MKIQKNGDYSEKCLYDEHSHGADRENCNCNTHESQKCGCGCCTDSHDHDKKGKIREITTLLISFAFLAASFIISEAGLNGIWEYLDFSWVAVFLCGVPIVLNAIKSLLFGKGFKGKITSDLLITIAMAACITLQILIYLKIFIGEEGHHSYIFAAGEVAWLMALGEAIEDFTVGKARSGIERLVKLSPTSAKYMIDGVIVEKPISEVKVGDTVVVSPNDMISVDGIIISGSTAVDQSIMTGESLPVDKTVGDAVYGGTWNKAGAIEVKVTKAEDEMTVTKLRKLVEEAEGKKAPISKTADKAASYIVPSAIALALIIAAVNLIFMGKGIFANNVASAIERGVTMLVVFCPCALVLATPTAVAAALGNATKKGILIKSGGALEMLARTKIIAFDKTGTLTYGQLEVSQIKKYDEDLLKIAASVEALSEHPVAKAIIEAYDGELQKPEKVEDMTGIGIKAVILGKAAYVVKWSELKDEFKTEQVKRDQEEMKGKNVVAVIFDGKLLGLIGLSDKIREDANDCIGKLKQIDIRPVMLTGDNAEVAINVASQTGIDKQNVYSGLMPEEKLEKIELLKKDAKVCMIGDGVNDAPALTAADSSVAMGALGSDVAIEAADVALMNNDIKNIPSLLVLARKMLRKVKINIAISMTINVLAVVLSATGILNPALGALVHNLSSVLVVCNSALLLLNKK